jgi:methionine sulfoxide reductase catalytic subunit
MLIRKTPDIRSSEITSKSDYLNRRKFIQGAAATLGAAAIGAGIAQKLASPAATVEANDKLTTVQSKYTTTGETLTSFKDITSYNNYYEFGTDKTDPAKYAGKLRVRPWTVQVEGLVEQKKTFDIDTLLKLRPQEERVYRHRCVEGWSMVMPWVGYSLSEFIKECKPTSKAQYVQFLTLDDATQMPGLRNFSYTWPYSEGLRMDEAMHPLTLLCFGLYGETLPNQDGAPIRLIIPWKYGFKSVKSIVKVKFVEKQPHTLWNDAAPNEYGFYSNVNPGVDHPRWSQKTERRIGVPFYKQVRPTLMFNGYGDQVAGMYSGMDLKKNF